MAAKVEFGLWSLPGFGKTPSWIPQTRESTLRSLEQGKLWGKPQGVEVFRGRHRVARVEYSPYHECFVAQSPTSWCHFDTAEEALRFAEGK